MRANGVLAEARLKALTSSDAITARGMRRDPITFEAEFKLVISSNHLPRLQNVTEAMRRRLQVIPFPVKIAEEKRDKDLEDRMLVEGSGILRWAIEGCLEWQRLKGLCPPDAVTEASKAYFESQDPISAFIDEQCELDPDAFVASSVLYDAYSAWVADSNQQKQSQSQFRSALIGLGVTPERRRTHNGYKGLRLNGAPVALAVV